MTIRWHLNEITNSSGLHLEVMKIYLTFLAPFFCLTKMPFFSLQGYPINAYTPRCLQYMVIQKYQWCTLVPLWMVEQKSYQNKKKKMVTIPTSKNESCKKLNINCHSIFAAFVLLLFYKWDKNTFFRGKKVTVKVKKKFSKRRLCTTGCAI